MKNQDVHELVVSLISNPNVIPKHRGGTLRFYFDTDDEAKPRKVFYSIDELYELIEKDLFRQGE